MHRLVAMRVKCSTRTKLECVRKVLGDCPENTSWHDDVSSCEQLIQDCCSGTPELSTSGYAQFSRSFAYAKNLNRGKAI